MEAIESRIQELGFNSHFLREMHMYAQLLGSNKKRFGLWSGQHQALQDKRFHMIDAHNLDFMQRSDTKVLAYRPFLELLRDKGREHAQDWLAHNTSNIGKRGTLDWKLWLN
jgi:NTE family protein